MLLSHGLQSSLLYKDILMSHSMTSSFLVQNPLRKSSLHDRHIFNLFLAEQVCSFFMCNKIIICKFLLGFGSRAFRARQFRQH